jgi:Fe-Mn family superoxide dismutase
MIFELPKLPYSMDALEPHLSSEALEFHYGKHHAAYVNNLNKLVPGTEFAEASLEAIIRKSSGAIFNNAAQIWNHSFYWHCLSPKGGGAPTGKLADKLVQSFGSVEKFKELFSDAALTLFGSGWAFLVQNRDGTLEINKEGNAGNPLTKDQIPLLTCDVWEHAYYIDYRNARAKYIEAFWSLVNWTFVTENLKV